MARTASNSVDDSMRTEKGGQATGFRIIHAALGELIGGMTRFWRVTKAPKQIAQSREGVLIGADGLLHGNLSLQQTTIWNAEQFLRCLEYAA